MVDRELLPECVRAFVWLRSRAAPGCVWEAVLRGLLPISLCVHDTDPLSKASVYTAPQDCAVVCAALASSEVEEDKSDHPLPKELSTRSWPPSRRRQRNSLLPQGVTGLPPVVAVPLFDELVMQPKSDQSDHQEETESQSVPVLCGESLAKPSRRRQRDSLAVPLFDELDMQPKSQQSEQQEETESQSVPVLCGESLAKPSRRRQRDSLAVPLFDELDMQPKSQQSEQQEETESQCVPALCGESRAKDLVVCAVERPVVSSDKGRCVVRYDRRGVPSGIVRRLCSQFEVRKDPTAIKGQKQ